jgi:hypothetical protein
MPSIPEVRAIREKRFDMKSAAGFAGLIVGVMFVVWGFTSGNTSIWTLGFILFALGVFLKVGE